jgi:translation initiation factor IF-2
MASKDMAKDIAKDDAKGASKPLKLNIKNPQIAEAINLKGLKAKLAKQKAEPDVQGESQEDLSEKESKGKKKPSVKESSQKKESKAHTLHEKEEASEKKKKAKTKAKEESSEEKLPEIKKEEKIHPAQPEAVQKGQKQVATSSFATTGPKEKAETEGARSMAVAEKKEIVESKAVSVSDAKPEQKFGEVQSKPTVGASLSQGTLSSQAPKPELRKTEGRPAVSHASSQPYRREASRESQDRYGSAAPRVAPLQSRPYEAKPVESRPQTSSDNYNVRGVTPRPQMNQHVQPAPSHNRPQQDVTGRPQYERSDNRYEQGSYGQRSYGSYAQGPRGQSGYGSSGGSSRHEGPSGDTSRSEQGVSPRPGAGPRQSYQGGQGYQGGPRQSGYQGGQGYQGGPRQSGYQGGQGYQGGPRQSGYQGGQGYQGGPRQSGYQGGQGYQGGPRQPGAPGRFPPRREGAPRDFARDTTGRHMPPPIAEIPDLDEESKRSRASFTEAGKHKAKTREQVVPKPTKRVEEKTFDARARHGFVSGDEDEGSVWRSRKRSKQSHMQAAQEIVRPSKIKVRLPISIKDLAVEMKLKASELISKLFIQGMVVTLNHMLDDATMVELLGHEFGCEVAIDTAEEERIRISDKSVREEISTQDSDSLELRPPIVAFMGHVDHGKTSLIDAIRKSNRAAKEVGAITQHIGAFKCETPQGALVILDTPGHEAFTLMRERGAEVTDIVVLVVAGDEGMQEQTLEALKQAQNARATIVVAITKCDKPNFDADLVYRQLAEKELLPEEWGGQTVVVKCSAVTGAGVSELLEMLALQAEVLELKANPEQRARGTVIESEMQQGLGAVATVLVQNGTLKVGDALVFGEKWARVKTMRDENGKELKEAPPSTPVRITGLSGLPQAGEEFIVVKNEKEAREIAEVRQEGKRETSFQKKRTSVESFMETAKQQPKKVFTIILRADVQGSLEALAKALEKIKSEKVELNILSQAVGQVSESDVQLAATSKACIIGFHTVVEAHADSLIKELGVKVLLHNIIYHVVDEVKSEMRNLLDKLPVEAEKGKAEVKAIFKASQLGVIAGCQVAEGSITRNCHIRLKRGKDIVWKGGIQSLKRVKEDVREVQKGIECGILLAGYNDAQVGDILEAYEINYIAQEL